MQKIIWIAHQFSMQLIMVYPHISRNVKRIFTRFFFQFFQVKWGCLNFWLNIKPPWMLKTTKTLQPYILHQGIKTSKMVSYAQIFKNHKCLINEELQQNSNIFMKFQYGYLLQNTVSIFSKQSSRSKNFFLYLTIILRFERALSILLQITS